ncbi:nucleotidyltransferase domain-containing protein [Pseudomarimonas arenosa]|uniref:Nucleotidyltransferase domain-containing protein n=1 Tax=Pseudomarimonas arenosa TaxID=2774145 RepID=A0AAW3ZPH7_9GAMM|nr:nucleotidyltransferase domain-containing protein [Pseudomarimonas arenosa]MBD8527420.1 nucleotidyltransferase domain-containing protein [Pseudomarimonas arenosa]
MLSLQPIPIEDERARFAGLLIFREQAWRQACEDHRNYWAWRAERNEARWQAQERGELDYDAKNLMHTIRLLLSGQSMLRRGLPIIRFEGEARDLLLRVRSGSMSYDEIMSIAQDIADDCERELERSDLPERCDASAADRLLADLTTQWEHRCQ